MLLYIRWYYSEKYLPLSYKISLATRYRQPRDTLDSTHVIISYDHGHAQALATEHDEVILWAVQQSAVKSFSWISGISTHYQQNKFTSLKYFCYDVL